MSTFIIIYLIGYLSSLLILFWGDLTIKSRLYGYINLLMLFDASL